MAHEVVTQLNALPEPWRTGTHEAIERQDGEGIWWAKLCSTSHKENTREITHEVDEILGSCGIDPVRWVDYFVSRSPRWGWDEASYQQDISRLREHHQPLGRYLVASAYDELAVDDELQLEMELATPRGGRLTMRLEARFWSDNDCYVPATDPRTEPERIDDVDDGSMIAYELTLRIEA